jgi:hypothetical protein
MARWVAYSPPPCALPEGVVVKAQQKACSRLARIMLRDRPLRSSGCNVGSAIPVAGKYDDGNMEQVSTRLSRAVDAAEIVLRRVDDEESGRPVLSGGWSRKQVLGHLIESASNNHQRFVRAALADALEFPAYDTPGSVRAVSVQSAAWPMVLDLWASYNRYLAHIILHLPNDKLDVVCRIGSNAPVSLRHLAQDYVEHLLHHLRQIGIATPS